MNDQGEVAYEIDKRRGRYVNICVSHDSDTEDDDGADRLAIELAQKATVAAQSEEIHADINEDLKEVVTVDPGPGIEPFEQERILDTIIHCVNGNTRAVQKYLETSSDAQLFIRGRHPDGKTALIIAAVEQSPEMVSILLEHGAEVNTVDSYGRSSLMEAALFGRIGNVEVLLEHGADKNARDRENRAAVDFARDHHKNKQERYERAGGDLTSNQRPCYIEDTFKRDIDRQKIIRLLSGENRKSKIVCGSPPTLSQSKSYSFSPSLTRDSLVLRGPIEEYPIARSWKTVARLERGGEFPSVGAMSGWSHGSLQPLRVDGRQWTDDVFYISEVTGHRLPSHPNDRWKDGEYNACHAEKQLIAYFIDRHAFLPRDRLPDSELEGEIQWVEDELHRFRSSTGIGHKVKSLRDKKEALDKELFDGEEKLVGKYDEIKALKLELRSVETALNRLMATPEARPILTLESRLKKLARQRDRHTELINMACAPPPASLAQVVILISSPACRDCIAFKDKVNEFFGLSIQLFAAL
ncbi:Ankyrin repeat protein [Aspergillus fischeri NRRL 181]|uniref:Ankyrin repeat protein n=1 Tax=Neosartorya fischeri (strain ATCC 1020 / DSM 3700 / CBS 544.65 / FGSC A1164 / JCM 1740 / NRRL 181 / WB 181) TaxID=331117 RepID=A1CVH8_NEOFI|nr:Ankyrin repeat protein [Aspergillus fischeri NRRL 181]EAW25755.1 Ankyrin repeat protein [Aspergillus fischeri NRRL 181]KAG2000851.1 hypothetical protein GB937_010770 [Aspergillus fischeri]